MDIGLLSYMQDNSACQDCMYHACHPWTWLQSSISFEEGIGTYNIIRFWSCIYPQDSWIPRKLSNRMDILVASWWPVHSAGRVLRIWNKSDHFVYVLNGLESKHTPNKNIIVDTWGKMTWIRRPKGKFKNLIPSLKTTRIKCKSPPDRTRVEKPSSDYTYYKWKRQHTSWDAANNHQR